MHVDIRCQLEGDRRKAGAKPGSSVVYVSESVSDSRGFQWDTLKRNMIDEDAAKADHTSVGLPRGATASGARRAQTQGAQPEACRATRQDDGVLGILASAIGRAAVAAESAANAATAAAAAASAASQAAVAVAAAAKSVACAITSAQDLELQLNPVARSPAPCP